MKKIKIYVTTGGTNGTGRHNLSHSSVSDKLPMFKSDYPFTSAFFVDEDKWEKIKYAKGGDLCDCCDIDDILGWGGDDMDVRASAVCELGDATDDDELDNYDEADSI